MTQHPDGTVTWRELLDEATDRLRDAGSESAPNDARRIVERASGTEGAEYIVALGTPATERGVYFFDLMLGRRLRGEPLQYVLGRWAFRTLDLFVDRRVLIPRPETEVVAGHAISELARLHRGGDSPLTVVDLGTGSGAIALSIATECPGVEVWASDVSHDALAVARANLVGIGPGATRVRLVDGSWFDALPAELRGAVDVFVSNPPYVADADPLPDEVLDWEPHRALFSGPTGLEALGQIVRGAIGWLKRPGSLVVELAPGQAGPLGDIAYSVGFDDVVVFDDLAGRERGLIARIA